MQGMIMALQNTGQKTTRGFMNGNSQAVRLPAGFRFEIGQVYIRKDERSGDVVLSAKPACSWASFVAKRAQPGTSGDLPIGTLRLNVGLRDPFEGWVE
jgi:antitoxin VapB